MNELYWIITLGNLNTAFLVFTFIFCVLFIMSSGLFIACLYENEEIDCLRKFKKASIATFTCLIISIQGIIFIPDTKSMYVIYGLGSVVDYLQDNPKAKNLPDKTLELIDESLNKYLEDYKK